LSFASSQDKMILPLLIHTSPVKMYAAYDISIISYQIRYLH
jgi:hypothetical protein